MVRCLLPQSTFVLLLLAPTSPGPLQDLLYLLLTLFPHAPLCVARARRATHRGAHSPCSSAHLFVFLCFSWLLRVNRVVELCFCCCRIWQGQLAPMLAYAVHTCIGRLPPYSETPWSSLPKRSSNCWRLSCSISFATALLPDELIHLQV